MKACVVQPAYCLDFSKSEEFFEWEISALDSCDESMDLIVLPEYSNVPCLAKTKTEMLESYQKYSKRLLEKAAETAKRCKSTLFVCCIDETPTGLRNTTVAFNKDGERVGQYYKQHLVPSEMNEYQLDKDYTYEHSEPTMLEIDGVRYGFLICYDFYFYEMFANMARYNPDVVIACAYQRSDTHEALELMSKFCAYNCNAYVVRSSVSLGADSPVGGTSLIVAPDGKTLLNMMNDVGLACAEFDPHERYLKPAGFGNPWAPHHNYIEDGRRPWKYRPGGSAIVRHDAVMPYPRICAHRGFSTIAPENSMPAFGAAVALGAEEMEFDIWFTKDGVPVSIHDDKLDRVSDGKGKIWDYTYEELLQYDFGYKFDEKYRGLRILKFEEILQKFACHVIMNIHIKTKDDNSLEPFNEDYIRELVRLIHKYDCKKYVYFMASHNVLLQQLKEIAPEIPRCCGEKFDQLWEIVDRAIQYDCQKVQLFKPYFNQEMIDKAHAHGIICNVFWSDDVEEAKKFLDMGIDCILTNDYLKVSQILK